MLIVLEREYPPLLLLLDRDVLVSQFALDVNRILVIFHFGSGCLRADKVAEALREQKLAACSFVIFYK